MKKPVVIVTVIGTLVMGALLTGSARSQEDAEKAGTQVAATLKVKQLQAERLAALKDLVEVTDVLYRKARAEAGSAYEARLQLLNAEVDLAESDAERIKFYENFVNVMKEYEDYAIARKQAARGTEIDILKAKAARLEAEIALEKVKSKAAK